MTESSTPTLEEAKAILPNIAGPCEKLLVEGPWFEPFQSSLISSASIGTQFLDMEDGDIEHALEALKRLGLMELAGPSMVRAEYRASPLGLMVREQLLRDRGRRHPALVRQKEYPLEHLIMALLMVPVIRNRRIVGAFGEGPEWPDARLQFYLDSFDGKAVITQCNLLQVKGLLESDAGRPTVDGKPVVGRQVSLAGQRAYMREMRKTLGLAETASILDLVDTPRYGPELPPTNSELQAELGVADLSVIRKIAAGGQGRVYQASQRDGTLVAVKVIQVPFSDDPDFSRFRREVDSLLKVNHPHVARHVGHGVTDDGMYPFVVMEFVDGLPLREWAAQKSRKEIVAALLGAIDGLQYLHSKQITHRDFRPANILVSQNGHATLVDLGLAYRWESPVAKTLTVEAVGTQGYIAPESAADHKRSREPPHDVYAIGVSLYELLAGRKPIHGETPELKEIAAELAPLDELVVRCTANGAKDRPRVREITAILDAWLADVPFKLPSKPASESVIHASAAKPEKNPAVTSELEISLSFRTKTQASDRHHYELVVDVKNMVTRRIGDWMIEVEMPTPLLKYGPIVSSRVPERSDARRTLFRVVREDKPLFGGDVYPFRLDYHVDNGIYDLLRKGLGQEPIVVRAFVDGALVSTVEKAAQQMQNF